jgi:hypothetical protein
MRTITLATETTRGRAGVYAYLADLASMAEWTEVVQSCVLIAGTAGARGATYRQQLDLGGTAYEGTIELTRVEADRRLVTVARTGPIKLTTTFELEDALEGTGGTAVRMILDPGVAGLPLASMFRAAGEVDIETLRQRLDRED